jgi:hypothetical protein
LFCAERAGEDVLLLPGVAVLVGQRRGSEEEDALASVFSRALVMVTDLPGTAWISCQ